jgi:hypothetical protein
MDKRMGTNGGSLNGHVEVFEQARGGASLHALPGTGSGRVPSFGRCHAGLCVWRASVQSWATGMGMFLGLIWSWGKRVDEICVLCMVVCFARC